MMKMTVREPDAVMKHWPIMERPTVRVLDVGARSASDAELLAVILRTGTRDASALDVARSMLGAFGGVSGLLRGIGDADAQHQNHADKPMLPADAKARLLAALELTRRSLREEMRARDCLASPQAVRDYLRLMLSRTDREVFLMILMNAQHQAIATEELFAGTLTQTSVYPREVVKCALRHNAAAVIFAHNHPSGIAEPSHADELLTRTLKSSLALVDVQVLDHFIVAGGGTLSFAERGLI